VIKHIDWLREAIRYTRARHPFEIDAVVVLPDHLHAIWTLPQGDSDYALWWRLIKTVFSWQLALEERRSQSRRKNWERTEELGSDSIYFRILLSLAKLR
jgi:putative transposase